MINPMRQGPTRVMGMMSGMDTESIIQATLRMHQFRIDSQLRNRRVLEWRQEIHNSIRDEITNLRQTFLSNLGSKSMMNRNAFNSNVATAIGRNSDAVTLRALAGGTTGQFRIGQISQLAVGATARTSNAAREDFIKQGVTGSTRLDSIDSFKGTESIASTDNQLNSLVFNGKNLVQLQVGGQSVRIDQTEIDAIDWSKAGEFTNKFTFNGVEVTLKRGTAEGTLEFETAPGEGPFNGLSGTVTFNDGKQQVNVKPLESTLSEDSAAEELTRNAHAEEIFAQFTRNDEGQILRNGAAVVFSRTHTMPAIDAKEATDDAEAIEARPAITFTQLEGADGTGGTVLHNGATFESFQTTTLEINTAKIEIRSNMTVNQMITAVNNSGAGVRMSFEPLTGRFTLETTSTGENSALILSGDSTINFLQKLGMEPPPPVPPDPNDETAGLNGASDTNGPTPPVTQWVFNGQDARVVINGDVVNVATNSFTFGGVSVTLNRTTDAEAGNEISVNVTRDTSGTMARIREFIDAYNSIISRLETLSNERKTGNQASFTPLTDEERRAMSDREVEEWERIARIGIMRGDQGIANLASNLRRSFFENIEGMGISASQIGLTTGNHFDGTGGQIMIDEERLRAALERDPDMVADIFIKIDESSGTPRGVGLLHKLNDFMRDFVNTNQATSLRNLEESVKRTNEQIERMETRMWAEEEKLYRQFAAMETALSRLQQQGDWFAAMLGG